MCLSRYCTCCREKPGAEACSIAGVATSTAAVNPVPAAVRHDIVVGGIKQAFQGFPILIDHQGNPAALSRKLSLLKQLHQKQLDEAVFKAKKGQLTGPVKTQFGFYVFEVTKVTPKSQQTLQQASQTIKGILASENQQKALDKFIKDFQKECKEKTNCRKGYVTQDCKNAPKATNMPSAPQR